MRYRDDLYDGTYNNYTQKKKMITLSVPAERPTIIISGGRARKVVKTSRYNLHARHIGVFVGSFADYYYYTLAYIQHLVPSRPEGIRRKKEK